MKKLITTILLLTSLSVVAFPGMKNITQTELMRGALENCYQRPEEAKEMLGEQQAVFVCGNLILDAKDFDIGAIFLDMSHIEPGENVF